MCGIYGFIGKPTKKTANILRGLGVLNQERGTDSTGIVLGDGSNITLLKKTVNATLFYNDKNVVKTLGNYSRGKFLVAIGHTRLATCGAVTDANAHPYHVGDWILAHNGVISNFTKLQATEKTSFEVDSQIIGHLLNTHNQKTVFEKDIEGMFATPHFKYNDPYTLYIAKHNAPVSFWHLPDGKGVYFSSVESHLKLAGKTVGLLGNCAIGGGSKLYTFKWDRVKNKLIKSKIKLNIPVKVYKYPQYAGSYGWHWDDSLDYPMNYNFKKHNNAPKKLKPAGFWSRDSGYLIAPTTDQIWEKSEVEGRIK
jgi:hypothetical protein